MALRLNHFCLIFGVVVVVLAMTVFAHAVTWDAFPSVCINDSKSKFLDLNAYVDINAPHDFNISISNNSTTGLGCFLENGSLLSCTLNSNRPIDLNLGFKVTDLNNSDFNYSSLVVSTRCYDLNGNDANYSLGGLSFSAGKNNVCMERGTTLGLPVSLSNFSNERKCFDLRARAYPDALGILIEPNQVCLNGGESTQLILSANTFGVDERNYNVKVWVKDTNMVLFTNYSVGNCRSFGGIILDAADASVCTGKETDVSVSVRNNSSDDRKIFLRAENSLVLPYFKSPLLELDSGETASNPLHINGRVISTGPKEITLLAQSDDIALQRRIVLNVLDCSEIVDRTFRLSVPSNCFDVMKGQQFTSQFTITRQVPPAKETSPQAKSFFLRTAGLPAELAYSSVSLVGNSSKSVNFTVNVSADAVAGNNYLKIIGSDGTGYGAFEESKTVCLNVLPQTSGELALLANTQAKEIQIGTTDVFELEVNNSGDTNADFRLAFEEIPTGVIATFSEFSFRLGAKESKKVFISVTPSVNAVIADGQKIVVKMTSPENAKATFFFAVKKSIFQQGLEVLSSDSRIEMNTHSQANFSVVVRNNSGADMQNVTLLVDGLPSDINADMVLIPLLADGATATLAGKISSGDTNGIFEPSFAVSSGSTVNKQKFTLVVNSNPYGNGLAGMFGFFAGGNFGQNGLVDLIFLAILLIIFVAVIVWVVGALTKPSNKDGSWAAN